VISESGATMPSDLLAGSDGLVLIDPRAVNVVELRRQGFEYVRGWVALPNLRAARWLIPVGSALVAAGALDIYTPYRRRARLVRSVARMITRFGGLQALGGSLWIARRRPPDLERRLAEASGVQEARLALHVGRGGRVPRVTAGVLDGAGRLRAAARIARQGSPGCDLLDREGALVAGLSARFGDESPAPRILASGSAEGFGFSVQSVLPGRPAPTRLHAGHRRFLDQLGGGPRRPLAAAAQVVELRLRAAAVDGVPQVVEALTNMEDELAGEESPRTFVHGDFAPWNLRQDGELVRAFDWEFGCEDGVPLFDEFHHRSQVGFLHGWTLAGVEAGLRATVAEQGASERRAAQVIAMLYAADRAVRALEETGDASSSQVARYVTLMRRLMS
jgi:hypothetical protein